MFTFILFSPSLLAEQKPLAFKNVHVISMNSEAIVSDTTVLIDGRRILAIGENIPLPKNATVIDAKGKYLMPGLAEMHAHIPYKSQPELQQRALTLNIANGVTTIRGMLGDASHLALKSDTALGKRLGPQIFSAGYSINGGNIRTIDDAYKTVTEQRAQGFDLLKIHPGLTLKSFNAIASTANSENMEFSGHIPVAVGLSHAIESGLSTVEHIDGFWQAAADPNTRLVNGGIFGLNYSAYKNKQRYQNLIKRLKEKQVWVTPTQTLFKTLLAGESAETLLNRPEMAFWPAEEVQQWVKLLSDYRQSGPDNIQEARKQLDLQYQLIKELHDAGVGVLLGADAPQIFNVPGFATLRELELMVKAGLSEYEAIKTATVNPAEYLGLSESFGTIEVGKRADLILLSKNPLDDISNIRDQEGVVVAGKWLPKNEIESLLENYKR